LAFFVGIGGFRSVITGRVVDADTTTHPIILKAQTKIFMMVPLFLACCNLVVAFLTSPPLHRGTPYSGWRRRYRTRYQVPVLPEPGTYR
jgi:hypothetical protein